jgi:hypothetical protein
MLAGLIVICAFLSGCASEERDVKVAEHAVDLFHSQLDAGEYSAIYQAAGAKMKGTTTEPNFVKLLQSVHQTLGAVHESVPKGITFQLSQGTILLSCYTTFAQGSGREQFEWKVTNGEAILYSYLIDSRDLEKSNGEPHILTSSVVGK